ncbi:hypothetical protein EGW08_011215 [Elysia chlorotica]|uniref:Endonuclease/exonuclease/phosphatase domain-containing protein n=1 Tax=Elysia chlorotica TaxID=188477 RepID=A0A3S1BCU5_ELYCH|nr:hypothetical protein EGW08_011215 [Elysia chlorotica]
MSPPIQTCPQQYLPAVLPVLTEPAAGATEHLAAYLGVSTIPAANQADEDLPAAETANEDPRPGHGLGTTALWSPPGREVIDGIRKTAFIDRDLQRLNIDITALQETRIRENGSLRTFSVEEMIREHGVGFAVRNYLICMIEPLSNDTEGILTLHLSTTHGPVNLISVYSPTMHASAPANSKDQFYESLDLTPSRLPPTEQTFLLRDFNGRIGADREYLGHHGNGNINETGQRLLELCCFHKLCVTNIFYNDTNYDKVSWRHPR